MFLQRSSRQRPWKWLNLTTLLLAIQLSTKFISTESMMVKFLSRVAFVFALLMSLLPNSATAVSTSCPSGYSPSGNTCSKPAVCQSGWTTTSSGCSRVTSTTYAATCPTSSMGIPNNQPVCQTYNMKTRTWGAPTAAAICSKGGRIQGSSCVVSSSTQIINPTCLSGTPQGNICVTAPIKCSTGQKVVGTSCR